jgi:hypothetical protein
MIDMLSQTFQCQVTGGVSTVWTGTAFKCSASDNEINLLHSRFLNETSRTCNDTNNNVIIVGEGIEVNGNNYTSQLNISFGPSLVGKIVKCVRDNGQNTSVISYYIITNDTIGIYKIRINNMAYFCHTLCMQTTPT